jgi:SAM-dependent methyltransferase
LIRNKDFEIEYRQRGAYHHDAKRHEKWLLHRNFTILAQHIRESKVVLDLGCGDGGLSAYLGRSRVIGIDSSKTGLELARVNSKIDCIRGDIRYLPIRDASIEAMACSSTLQYIPRDNIGTAFLEMARVAKDHCHLSLSYPNSTKVDKYSGVDSIEILNLVEMRTELKNVGFTIVRELGIKRALIPTLSRFSKSRYALPLAWLLFQLGRIMILPNPSQAHDIAIYCEKGNLNAHKEASANISTL